MLIKPEFVRNYFGKGNFWRWFPRRNKSNKENKNSKRAIFASAESLIPFTIHPLTHIVD